MALVTLGSKAVGSVVKIKVNGTAWEWIVVHQGNPSTSVYDASCNGTWLLLKNIYEERQWHSSNRNDYANSTIHAYLNDTWYNLIDASIRGQIKQVKIPYRPGSGTSSTINSGANGLSTKLFLLGGYEIGYTQSNFFKDGVKLAYFIAGNWDSAEANARRVATGQQGKWWLRTPDGGTGSKGAWYITGNGNFHPDNTWNVCTSTHGVRPAMVLPTNIYVDDGNNVIANPPPTTPGSISIPATIKGGATAAISWTASTDPNGNLAGYILERSASGGGWTQIYKGSALSYTDTITKGWTSVAYRVKAYDSGNAMSGYKTSETRTVINNTAPGVPASLSVPTSVIGGKTLAVSWGAATDADNNLSGYILERQYNGGGWTQLYKGTARSYTDTITKGWTSVAYRVKAYDSEGAQSGYRTSETRTVFNNTAPTISGSDSSLGTKTGAFSQSYTVTDPDAGQTLSVTEKLDGVTRRTYTATSGAANSFAVTAAEWIKILNGTHTIAISVSDGNGGSATRTWTFAKNTTEIDVTLASPLTADAMPTKGVANIVGELPAGAQVTFEVCNNGFDAAPAWEDVTSQVLGRNKFFLANKTKTAAKWGFNFRLRVSRGSASGTIYIESVGGNFE